MANTVAPVTVRPVRSQGRRADRKDGTRHREVRSNLCPAARQDGEPKQLTETATPRVVINTALARGRCPYVHGRPQPHINRQRAEVSDDANDAFSGNPGPPTR